jgi:hypothetical protein
MGLPFNRQRFIGFRVPVILRHKARAGSISVNGLGYDGSHRKDVKPQMGTDEHGLENIEGMKGKINARSVSILSSSLLSVFISGPSAVSLIELLLVNVRGRETIK